MTFEPDYEMNNYSSNLHPSNNSSFSKNSTQNKICSTYSNYNYERVIAIDNGSEWSKIGFVDDEHPYSVFPTIMGYPRYYHLDEATGTNDLYIGDNVFISPNVYYKSDNINLFFILF